MGASWGEGRETQKEIHYIHIYTEIEKDQNRERHRVRKSQSQTMKSPRKDMGNGGVLAGLRDHQRSVLGPSRGNPEAFPQHWVSPEDHSEEFIPL